MGILYISNKNKNIFYIIYNSPPFATGTPHYGHILAGTIKVFIFARVKI